MDRKENVAKKKFESHEPHHEDSNGGVVIMEDGESDVNVNSEPADLERQEEDNKPDAVSSDDDHSPSLAVDARDNMQ